MAFCVRAKSNLTLLKADAIIFTRSSTEPEHLHHPPWLTSDITQEFLKACDRSSFDIIYLVSGKARDLELCQWGRLSYLPAKRSHLRQREFVPAMNWSPGRLKGYSQEAGGNNKPVCGRLLASISPAVPHLPEAVSFPHRGRQSLSGRWAGNSHRGHGGRHHLGLPGSWLISTTAVPGALCQATARQHTDKCPRTKRVPFKNTN